jgi:Virulence factor membrane-bound polymerase, C-terminal/O-Antigen ligase/Protein glycosylation ligase
MTAASEPKAFSIKKKCLVCLAIALPWSNPFAPGPTPNVVPLLFSWTCGALTALVLVGSRCERGLAELATTAWLTAALLSGAVALLQFTGLAGGLAPWVSQTQIGEAFGNLRQRNQFASLTMIGLVALIWVMGSLPGAGVTPLAQAGMQKFIPGLTQPKWSGWPACAGLVLGVGNAASSSRTGLVQLLAVLLLARLWRQTRIPPIQNVLIVTAAAYCVATLLLPMTIGMGFGGSGLLARVSDGAPSCASRLVLWGNVVHLIALKPLAGWGWGELDFAHFDTLYPGQRFCEILDNAHNLPLHLAVEFGLPIAVLICALVAWWALLQKPWSERDISRQMAWGTLLLIFLHSLLEYPLWYGPFQMATLLCVLMLATIPKDFGDAPSDQTLSDSTWFTVLKGGPGLRLGVTAVSIAMIGTLAYASWDYHRVSQIYMAPQERSAQFQMNTLEKIRPSWLFKDQVQFAELTMAQVTPENAQTVHAMAHRMLHFSPEGRVVEKLIQSARMLGRENEVAYYRARLEAAFPAADVDSRKVNRPKPATDSP